MKVTLGSVGIYDTDLTTDMYTFPSSDSIITLAHNLPLGFFQCLRSHLANFEPTARFSV